MAGDAKICRLIKNSESCQGVPIRQRRACGQHILTQGDMTRQWDIRGKRVVEAAIWVRRKANAREELTKFAHLSSIKPGRSGLQIRKRLIERLDIRTIPSPMKWFVPDDVLQRLCHHYSFHRMIIIRDHHPLTIDDRTCQSSSRIAQVPTKPVHAPIHVTRCARSLPKS